MAQYLPDFHLFAVRKTHRQREQRKYVTFDSNTLGFFVVEKMQVHELSEKMKLWQERGRKS